MSIERFNDCMNNIFKYPSGDIPIHKKLSALENELAKQDRLIEGIREAVHRDRPCHVKNFNAMADINELLRLYDNSD